MSKNAIELMLLPLLGLSAVSMPGGLSAGDTPHLDLSGLVAQDSAVVNTPSACVPTAADSSGLFGWYLPPQEMTEVVFTPTEVITGTRFGGETMAVATNERVLAFEKDNTDQIPNLVATLLTSADIVTSRRDPVVSPLGDEIALYTRFFNPLPGPPGPALMIRFFRRSAMGWQSVAAQTLPGTRPAYSKDGLTLALLNPSNVLEVYSRNPSGNWQLDTEVRPAKPSSFFAQSFGWSGSRLVIGDRDIVWTYRKVGTEYLVTQAFPAVGDVLMQRLGNAFYIVNNINLTRFDWFGSNGFMKSWEMPRTSFGAENAYAGNTHGVLSQNSGSNVSCASAGSHSFTVTSNVATNARYFFPETTLSQTNGLAFDVDPSGAVVGVTLRTPIAAPKNTLYFIVQDRIFGGQNVAPGTNGSGQGSFE